MTRPEQGNVPLEVELAQLLGRPIVDVELPAQGGHVTQFQQVGHEEAPASERHHAVPARLGQLYDLGGQGQALL
jgi:hypothetical protein